MIPGLSTLRGLAIGLMVSGVALISASGWALWERHGRFVVEKDFSDFKAAVAVTAANAAERASTELIALQQRIQEAQDVAAQAQARSADMARDLARTRSDLGGVRDQLASYARGSGRAQDSYAEAVDRAEALGRALEDSLRVQEELAGEAEHASDIARELYDGHPGRTGLSGERSTTSSHAP